MLAVTAMSTTLTTTFGTASRRSVETMGPSRSRRRRAAPGFWTGVDGAGLRRMRGSCAIGGCGRSITIAGAICLLRSPPGGKVDAADATSGLCPAGGHMQRLGERPDRVTEKTRRRNAGEVRRSGLVTAARVMGDLEIEARTVFGDVCDTVVSLSQ